MLARALCILKVDWRWQTLVAIIISLFADCSSGGKAEKQGDRCKSLHDCDYMMKDCAPVSSYTFSVLEYLLSCRQAYDGVFRSTSSHAVGAKENTVLQSRALFLALRRAFSRHSISFRRLGYKHLTRLTFPKSGSLGTFWLLHAIARRHSKSDFCEKTNRYHRR